MGGGGCRAQRKKIYMLTNRASIWTNSPLILVINQLIAQILLL